MPRSRSASATRRARFSSIAPKYVPSATARARSPDWPRAVRAAGWPRAARARADLRDLAGHRVRAEEAGDHLPEPLTLVFLQEVPGARDHRVLQAGRSGDGALQDGGHAPGDRVAVAEGDKERLVPGGQPLPGRAVGRR